MSFTSTSTLPVDRSCRECPVRNRAVCMALQGADFIRLSDLSQIRDYQQGDIIWEEGSNADIIGIVVAGVADISKLLPDGREHIVGLLFSSDWLGQLYRPRNMVTAKAVTDLRLCTFQRLRFETALAELPHLEHQMFMRLLSELEETRNWMVSLMRKNAGQRVADFLLNLSRRQALPACQQGDDPEPASIISLPLTRGETANYRRLTIETVSRCISKLRLAGLIKLETQRTIHILDAEALARYAAPDD